MDKLSADPEPNTTDAPRGAEVDSDALFEEGIGYHQSGRLTEARACYTRLLALEPANSAIRHILGVACLQQDDLTEAERHLRAAISLTSGRAAYHSSLGSVLKAQRRYSDAIIEFERALALEPDLHDALNNLGGVHVAAGNPSAAEGIYRKLLEADPGSASAMQNLGVVLFRLGRTGEARRLLEKALALRPDFGDAHVSLGRLYFDASEFERAAEHLQAALQQYPDDPEVMKMLAHALRDRDPSAALRHAKRAIEICPGDASNHVALGSVQQALGHLDQAEIAYNKALQIDPVNADALNNLGTICKGRDENSRALGFFRAAIESRDSFADAHYNLGTVLQEIGDTTRAIGSFERSLQIRPELNLAYRCLLDIYQATGRREQAVEVVERWLTFEPDNPTALHMLAAAGRGGVPSRASDEYVREEFDRFASGFDKTLARLNYRAPERLVDCLRAHVGLPLASILDAGCGTGLAAPLLDPLCEILDGVDLSPKMIERARARQRYDGLFTGDLVEFMIGHPAAYDLVFSADTLVYFGDLMPLLRAARSALRAGGYVAASVEHWVDADTAGFRLNSSGRYGHTRGYMDASLKAAGFDVLEIREEVLREELNRPVAGLVVLARLSSGSG